MKQEMGMVAFLTKHPARHVVFALVALAMAWAAVNYPVMLTLWRHGFDDGTYSHAYLIPFIFIYLLIVLARRGELQPRTSVFMPAVIAFVICAIGYYFSLAAQLSLAYWVFSLALLACAYWMFVRFSLGLLYALAFLVFMYPMWGALQFVLQHMSVYAVMKIMGLTGIPTYVENTSVMIPEGTFVIAGGCSGLRYFIVSLAISSLFVFLNLRNKVSITKFITLAIIGALITNWIRIVALVLIGHFSDMQSELMRDHNNFGWYIYAPFIILLFWYGERLVKKESASQFQDLEDAAVKQAFPLSGKNLLVATLLLCISSSALQLKLLPSAVSVAADCSTLSSLDEFAPTLPYDPQLCVRQQHAAGTGFDTVSAIYNGNDPDGKPTQYQVLLAPLDWKPVTETVKGSWTLRVYTEKRRHHFIAYSYITPEQQVATESEMKAARIEAAMSGERRSGLLWAHAVCVDDCSEMVKQWPAISQAFTFNRF